MKLSQKKFPRRRHFGIVFLVLGFYGVARFVLSHPTPGDLTIVGMCLTAIVLSIGLYLYVTSPKP